jgi:hypothetical protein
MMIRHVTRREFVAALGSGAAGPAGTVAAGADNVFFNKHGRLDIPNTRGIPLTTLVLETNDGARWVRTSDSTQPTYTVDADGHGWMLDQSSGYAKLMWFKNARAMAMSDWDSVGLTGTDNAVALLEANAFGRKVCAAGKRFVLDATPNHANGCWGFNYNKCVYALANLILFTLEGGGAKFQNIQGHGARPNTYNPWFQSAFSNGNVTAGSSGFAKSYFPVNANAEPGATSVTLSKSSDTSYFSVGDWIAIASLSIQYSGYPHNWDHIEFVQVTGISSGAISFTPALRYEHRTDFPDDLDAGQFPGAVKVVQLNSPVGALYHPTGFSDTVTWDVDQTFRNMTVLPAVNSTLSYVQINGRKIRIENSIWVGNSESMCGEFSSFRTIFNAAPEPDKNVGRVHHVQSRWTQGMTFQSTSFGSVILDDCVVEGGSGLSVAGHHVIINGGYLSNFTVTANGQGISRSIILNGVQASASPYDEPIVFPGMQMQVDGTDVQFTNGTFKCSKTYNGLANIIRVRPGAQLVWRPNPASVGGAGVFSGDLGLMTVTKVYQNATFCYWETTSPFTSTPSWSDGYVYIPGVQSVLMNGCNGCDELRRGSEACRRGKRVNELFKATFVGKFSTNGYWQNRIIGTLQKFRIHVRQTTSVVGSPYFMVEIPLFSGSAPTTRLGTDNLRLLVDLTHTGLREVTTSGTSGFQGTDSLTYAGSGSPTAIPATNALVGIAASWSCNINTSLYSVYQLPIIDVEIETDLGMLGTLTTASGESGGVVASIVGQIP